MKTNASANERFFREPIVAHLQQGVRPATETQNVGQVLADLRAQPPAGRFFYVYVVDATGKLVGVVSTRDLLLSPSETPISTLVEPKIVALDSDATVLDACEFFIQHRFLALPVVDRQGKLLGTVDVGLVSDEVFNLAEQRSRDNAFQIIGVHVLRNQRLAPWASFRDRFPWLIANIVGGTLCAWISSRFEHLLAAVIAVAMFVPIVLTLAESVSIQSMSILLAGLGPGRIGWRFLTRSLAREFVVALLLGAACGTVAGTVAWFWLGLANVSLSVALSITMALVAASLLGVALPLAIHAMRVDPGVAAGPIVLADHGRDDLAVLFFDLPPGLAAVSFAQLRLWPSVVYNARPAAIIRLCPL